MISNFKQAERKNDIKILCGMLFVFFIAFWLCTPPGNKFAQVCFWGNNTQYIIAKLTKTKEEIDEWKFHRNNAIYLALMDRKDSSMREMNKAIESLPSYASDREVSALYADRAQLRLYWGEYKLALDDYIRVEKPSIIDKFKIALLYKEVGNYRYALSYCNSILNTDPTAYIGYACVADIYAGLGNYSSSVRVYDLLIDKRKNRAQYYVDRAFYKNLAGDIEGFKADMEKAREINPSVDDSIKIVEEIFRPKKLTLKSV